MNRTTRREWLSLTPAALAAGTIASVSIQPPTHAGPMAEEPFGYCLNSSTIMGQKLAFLQVVDVASKAGYQAIEPWIRELEAHVESGGTLADAGKRIKDAGLTVESAIGFAEWA